MADNLLDEGGQNSGTAQNANAGASADSGSQPSQDAAKLKESLDALTQGLQTLEKRVNGLQGVKDTQGQELSGLKTKIAEYEQLKEKLGAAGALEQIEFRDQFQSMAAALQDIQGKLSTSASTTAPGTGASGAVNAAKAFAEWDLDLKDPRVADALGRQYPTQEAAELAASRVFRQIQQSPNPTAAQTAALQGGNHGSVSHDTLLSEMNELLQGNDIAAIRKKEEELKAAGVPGWTQ